MVRIIDYDRERDEIENLDALPKGLGCKLLLVIDSIYDNVYIAKKWLRKMRDTKGIERIIRF